VKLYDRTQANADAVWWQWREESCTGVAFSPNGKLLAIACGGTSKFRLWSMTENKEIILPESGVGPTLPERMFHGGVVSAAFSSDGKYVAAGVERWADGNTPRPGFIRVWEVATRSFVRDIHCREPQPVRGIGFFPQGTTVAAVVKAVQAGQQPLVEVWDAVTGAEVNTIKLTGSTLGPCISFARREPLLAITYDHFLDVRRVGAFTEQPLLRTATEVSSVAITPHGDYVAVALDNHIELCEVASRKWLKQLQGHRGQVWALTITSDGKTLISGASDREVREWPLP
jgi:WD40 repeat protein